MSDWMYFPFDIVTIDKRSCEIDRCIIETGKRYYVYHYALPHVDSVTEERMERVKIEAERIEK